MPLADKISLDAGHITASQSMLVMVSKWTLKHCQMQHDQLHGEETVYVWSYQPHCGVMPTDHTYVLLRLQEMATKARAKRLFNTDWENNSD